MHFRLVRISEDDKILNQMHTRLLSGSEDLRIIAQKSILKNL